MVGICRDYFVKEKCSYSYSEALTAMQDVAAYIDPYKEDARQILQVIHLISPTTAWDQAF